MRSDSACLEQDQFCRMMELQPRHPQSDGSPPSAPVRRPRRQRLIPPPVQLKGRRACDPLSHQVEVPDEQLVVAERTLLADRTEIPAGGIVPERAEAELDHLR